MPQGIKVNFSFEQKFEWFGPKPLRKRENAKWINSHTLRRQEYSKDFSSLFSKTQHYESGLVRFLDFIEINTK